MAIKEVQCTALNEPVVVAITLEEHRFVEKVNSYNQIAGYLGNKL